MREMVEETIDLDELDRHNFVIKPEFDETLGALKERLEGVRDQLDEQHREVAGDLDMETDNKILHFEQHSLYGYCFRLTRKVRRCPTFVVRVRADQDRAPSRKAARSRARRPTLSSRTRARESSSPPKRSRLSRTNTRTSQKSTSASSRVSSRRSSVLPVGLGLIFSCDPSADAKYSSVLLPCSGHAQQRPRSRRRNRFVRSKSARLHCTPADDHALPQSCHCCHERSHRLHQAHSHRARHWHRLGSRRGEAPMLGGHGRGQLHRQ